MDKMDEFTLKYLTLYKQMPQFRLIGWAKPSVCRATLAGAELKRWKHQVSLPIAWR
jgi:hypothetical protein